MNITLDKVDKNKESIKDNENTISDESKKIKANLESIATLDDEIQENAENVGNNTEDIKTIENNVTLLCTVHGGNLPQSNDRREKEVETEVEVLPSSKSNLTVT